VADGILHLETSILQPALDRGRQSTEPVQGGFPPVGQIL
jgi:hypothetical protein